MSTATVTSKGQITIPAEVREQLNIKVGDQLVFQVEADGRMRLRVRRPKVGSGRGTIAHDGTELSRKAIGEAVAEGVARRIERTRLKLRKKASSA